jgi:hypothetical protein
MSSTSRNVVVGLGAAILCLANGPAGASDNSTLKMVMVGRLPDLIFPAGRSSCLRIPGTMVRYQGVVNNQTIGNSGLIPIVGSGYPHIKIANQFGSVPLDCNRSGDPAPGAWSNDLGGYEFGEFVDTVGFIQHAGSVNDNYLWVRSDGTPGQYSITWQAKAGELTYPDQRYPIGVQSVFVTSSPSTQDNAFTQVVTAANRAVHANSTTISHPFLDNSPQSHIVLTSVWNYGNVSGVYNDHPIAAIYGFDIPGQWSIVNTDGGTLQIGAQFNVEVESADLLYYRNDGTPDGYLDPVDLENIPLGDSYAMLFPTSLDPANPHALGSWFDGGGWWIFNEDFATMNTAQFDILPIGSPDPSIYCSQESGNVFSNSLLLPWRSTVNANSRLFISVNWNLLHYLSANTGIWWNSSSGIWEAFTQSGSMPSNVQVNVFKHLPALLPPN